MAGQITHSWNGTVLTITSDSGTSSCDLKGAQGDMGIRGPQGIPGAMGETGAPGKDGNVSFNDLSEEQKASLKGDPGDDGYTPVKGVDYWTDADIAEIKNYVDEAILGGAW